MHAYNTNGLLACELVWMARKQDGGSNQRFYGDIIAKEQMLASKSTSSGL